MLEFLKKNTELVETFKKPTMLYEGGELTYYHFKIGEHHFMLSINEVYMSCVLSDYIVESESISKMIAMGSKNNIKEAIKKLVIRYGN